MAQPNWMQLARYLEGHASTTEAAEVRQWIEAKPSHAAFVEDLRKAWRAAGEDRVQWDVDAAVAKLAAKASPPVEPTAIPIMRRVRRTESSTRWRNDHAGSRRSLEAAAAIAVLIGAGIIGTMVMRAPDGDPTVAAGSTFSTAKGQRKAIALPDGSRVLLNVSSQLTIAASFGSDERNVRLQGGAYFEVASDSSMPFIVRAGNVTTRVLGTRFGVRAYPEDRGVQVVVEEGSVALSARKSDAAVSESAVLVAGQPDTADSGAAVLTAGQLGHVSNSSGTIVVSRVDPALVLSWIEGRLVFRDIALEDVLVRLERWYDVDFKIADPDLGARKFTGTVALGTQSLGEILGAIALALDATYRVDGRTVEFGWRP